MLLSANSLFDQYNMNMIPCRVFVADQEIIFRHAYVCLFMLLRCILFFWSLTSSYFLSVAKFLFWGFCHFIHIVRILCMLYSCPEQTFSKPSSFIAFSGLGIAYLAGSIPKIDLNYQTYICMSLFSSCISKGLSHEK